MAAIHDRYLSENTALRIECEAQEAEITELKSFLHQSVVKPELYPGQQHVTLNKGLNAIPEKAWQHINESTPQIESLSVIRALEKQLDERNKRVAACLQEIDELNDRLKVEQPFGPKSDEKSTAHLLSQISFLHNEVERLECQVASVRSAGKEEVRSLNKEYTLKLEQKEKEIRAYVEQLRGSSRKNRVMEGEDLLSRCKILENQLAIAISEKNSLAVEKSDFALKIRKMEAALKDRKQAVVEAQKIVSQESQASSTQVRSLQEVIQVLSDERSLLQKKLQQFKDNLNTEKLHIYTQTEFSFVSVSSQTDLLCSKEKDCQVDSMSYFGDVGMQSTQSLTHMLELKCAECDELRVKLDEFTSAHEEVHTSLAMTRKQLADEVERRKLLSDDAEKLSLQVRSLQQKCSQEAATERELNCRLSLIEEQKRELKNSIAGMEQEKNTYEERLQQYQKDMEQLVANKNYCNQQVDQLASENERLREELQRLHQREAQMTYSLKAKDGELREILSAYQNAVRETELYTDGQKTIERELETTRATLASKEQGIIYLQEQLNQLHHRDQQLSLDLQSFEYENAQLHRKVVQTEALVTQLEVKCDDLQQLSHSKDRASDELQQSLAELSKQVVLKENECMLLRHRCEALQRDFSRLQSAFEVETQRMRELENTNARLVVRGMINNNDDDERYNSLQQEIECVKQALGEKSSALKTVEEELRKEREERIKCTREMEAAQASLEEALMSKERLQQVVLDQAATLSHLSR